MIAHSKVSQLQINDTAEGLRLIRDIASLVDQQAQEYIASLRSLHCNLLGQAIAVVMVYHVFDKLEDLG